MLADGPRVLDCLEFDDALRYGDVLADVTFLAMDLERLGAPERASRFLTAYRELSGETYPVSLEHHYVASRAHIRAKVACLRGDPAATEEAGALVEIALRHLRRARVMLTLVGGDPGTGKSTLAAGLADHTSWTVLRSDEVRKDLAGVGHTTGMASPAGEGIYDERAIAETYAELVARARLLLEWGESVLLDATWHDARQREAAGAIASSTSSELVELRCDAPLTVREARVGRRARLGSDASDATVKIARELAGRADPWPTAIVIDTVGGIDKALASGLRATGGR
jgi:predicted kinase